MAEFVYRVTVMKPGLSDGAAGTGDWRPVCRPGSLAGETHTSHPRRGGLLLSRPLKVHMAVMDGFDARL